MSLRDPKPAGNLIQRQFFQAGRKPAGPEAELKADAEDSPSRGDGNTETYLPYKVQLPDSCNADNHGRASCFYPVLLKQSLFSVEFVFWVYLSLLQNSRFWAQSKSDVPFPIHCMLLVQY